MCNAAPVLIYPVDEYPNGEAEAFCAAITNAGSGQAVSVMMAAHYTQNSEVDRFQELIPFDDWIYNGTR